MGYLLLIFIRGKVPERRSSEQEARPT
jgi:hypothetical protein